MARNRRKGKKKSLLTVLVILAVIVLAVNVGKNWIVKTMIERVATNNLKVPVHIGGLNLTLTSGQIAIRSLTIGNPTGFNSPHLLHLTEGEAHFDIHSLMEPVLVVDRIALNGLSVYYEVNENGNNVDNVVKVISPPPAKESKVSGKTKPPRELIIRNLDITDIAATPMFNFAGQTASQRIQIADIHLRDIGREGKTVTVAEASEIVMNSLSKNLDAKLPSNLIEKGLKSISKGTVKKGFEDIKKGIFGN
ncbi:MAG: hypothetical protein EYC62_09095 [Alphaproteobacteria bacterium]|nr:MAG: hypothetical protein EYC62_09095 [Alphaproteobacteria bacterium]